MKILEIIYPIITYYIGLVAGLWLGWRTWKKNKGNDDEE